jgi:hypothetical protein
MQKLRAKYSGTATTVGANKQKNSGNNNNNDYYYVNDKKMKTSPVAAVEEERKYYSQNNNNRRADPIHAFSAPVATVSANYQQSGHSSIDSDYDTVDYNNKNYNNNSYYNNSDNVASAADQYRSLYSTAGPNVSGLAAVHVGGLRQPIQRTKAPETVSYGQIPSRRY